MDDQGEYFEKRIGSKPCWEVIDDMPDITDKEKDLMKNELPIDLQYLCPDIKSLTIEGNVLKMAHSFELNVSLNDPL